MLWLGWRMVNKQQMLVASESSSAGMYENKKQTLDF